MSRRRSVWPPVGWRRGRIAMTTGTQPPITAAELIADIDQALGGETDRRLLLYLHVPFCSSKCTFCDWVADIPARQLVAGPSVRDRYVRSLSEQIRRAGPALRGLGYTPRFAYWGGGTPSRLAPEELWRIGSTLQEAFTWSGLDQHTIEASPETLGPETLAVMRALGMDRVSLGVQSFDDAELRRCARSHSAAQAHEAVARIRRAGFTDFNLDLIAGLPGQTLDVLVRSVLTAIELDPPHLSLYVYRPDPGTVMARQAARGGRDVVAPEGLERAYDAARAALQAAGYAEYTTYYFAKSPAFHFRAEQYYFEMQGDYVGFGPGAHSVRGHRLLRNVSSLERFCDEPLEIETCRPFSPLEPHTLGTFLNQALMTDGGIDFQRFRRFAGFSFACIRDHSYIGTLVRRYQQCGGRFEETERALRLTPATRSRATMMYLAGFYEAGRLRGMEGVT
jgi:coproporphyrinogen III oxidase-like Fe-S oxidoreductase